MTLRSVGAIVVAAGSGDRLGASLPKSLVVLHGRPIVAWAVQAVIDAGIDQVVVTAPAEHTAAVADALQALRAADVRVVAGGATRSASVRCGFAALDPRPDVVLVHDAARPAMPAEVIRATALAIGGDVLAAAPGLPVADTLKRVAGDGSITATVDRGGLWAVQTPQAFTGDVLAAVHAWAADREATDDLGLFEAAVTAGAVHGRAVLVDGHRDGDKVTYASDLARVEQVLAARGGDA